MRREEKRRKREQEEKKVGREDEEDLEEEKEYIQQKESGKDVSSDGIGRVRLKGALLHTYILSILIRTVMEVTFIVVQYMMYGVFLKALYLCNVWPCPNPVNCYMSRPTEKNVFIVFMLVVADFNHCLTSPSSKNPITSITTHPFNTRMALQQNSVNLATERHHSCDNLEDEEDFLTMRYEQAPAELPNNCSPILLLHSGYMKDKRRLSKISGTSSRARHDDLAV
uniref:Connexin 45.6 n=1 Tax=Nothobranchius kuhntae TaxID=321403 RepID=A0A1A8IGJ7_NOTKU